MRIRTFFAAAILIAVTQNVSRPEPFAFSLEIPQEETTEEELSRRVSLLEQEYADIEKSLEKLRKDSEGLKKNAKARLMVLYKFKQIGYATPLLFGAGPDSTIDTGYVAGKLLLNDHRILLDLHERNLEIKKLEALSFQKREKIRQLELRANAYERDLLEHDLVNLHRRALNRKPVFGFTWTPFSTRRGALPPPTDGEISAASASKVDASSRSILYNRGVIINAPKGQPVRAIHEGIIVFADWFKDYGNVMIVDHGNHYYSLIAHADKLLKKVGEIVKSEEIIATVGNTGSQGDPKLYFEIRHHGKPVDPAEWLAVRKSFKE